MSSTTQSPNWREIISAQNDITGKQEYITSHNHALNVAINGTVTTNNVQYTQGGATVANPTGTAEIWFDASGNPKAVTPSQPLPSNITDGTNIANVRVNDTGTNGLGVNYPTLSVAFTTSSSGAQDLVAAMDCRGYSWVMVQFTSIGSGLTAQGSFSLDVSGSGTYISPNSWVNSGSVANAMSSGPTISVANFSESPILGNSFKLRATALVSGTVTGIVTFFTAPRPARTLGVSAAQNGTWTVGANSATGSAVPANAFYMGLSDGTNLRGATGNIDTAALITAAGATTTQTGADQTNFNARGVKVVLDMTTVGTGSVTLEIDGKDAASGKYYAILTGAAVVSNSTNVYTIYPGVTAAANISVSDVLPKVWRVKVTANNANATTYTVGASVIL